MRQDIPDGIQRVVIKLGSNAVTQPKGGVDEARLSMLIEDIAWLHTQSEVIIVSSGAIQTGRALLKDLKPNQENEVGTLQALSAIGQPTLLRSFQTVFDNYNIQTAQVLLTHEDFKNRNRYFNAHRTLKTLIEHRVVPIINENDSVSYAEITVGDNDQLAAMIAGLLDVDLLLMLTQTDGVYDKNPNTADAKKIESVSNLSALGAVKTSGKSTAGRGGMRTKLQAVEKVWPLGIPTLIASYEPDHPIRRALTQISAGTLFLCPEVKQRSDRKTWLQGTCKTDRGLVIDDGAARALRTGQASLLFAGVLKIIGAFVAGDGIAIFHKGKVFAVGLVSISSRELEKKYRNRQTQSHPLENDVVIYRENLDLRS